MILIEFTHNSFHFPQILISDSLSLSVHLPSISISWSQIDISYNFLCCQSELRHLFPRMLESGEFISFSDRIDCNRLEHGASEKELDYSSCCRQKRSDRSSSSIRRLVSWCYCWGAGIGMLLQLVVVALLCVKVSYTSTHWVVSDDGRLKSVVGSKCSPL